MGYVTARQAAKHLGVSDDTVRRRAKAGEWPSRQDAAGRLLVDVPGMPEVVGAVVAVPVPGAGPGAGGQLQLVAADQLRQAQAEIEFLRAQLTETTAALRQALRPARQTRRMRQLLAGGADVRLMR